MTKQMTLERAIEFGSAWNSHDPDLVASFFADGIYHASVGPDRLGKRIPAGRKSSILSWTGHLARARSRPCFAGMKAPFDWEGARYRRQGRGADDEDIILRRLQAPVEADKIMLPGTPPC